jgi:Asp-tRNA(Asn)/Glu-tRNA(Gln) amidotransferase A subunit family amidase
MARTTEDAAAVLEVLVGFDPNDPATEPIRDWPVKPSVLGAMGDGLEGVRIGVLRQAYQGDRLRLDPQVARIFARALTDFGSLGATVVDSVSIGKVDNAPLAELCQGLKYDLNEYLARKGDRVPVHNVAAILTSGKFDPTIGDDLRAMQATDSQGPGSAACVAGTRYREAVAAALSAEMDRLQLDVLVYPTWSQIPQLTSHINAAEAGQSLRFATASGNPAITLPMGFTQEGLPVGFSLLGRKWTEAGLVRVAYAYEQATRHRRPPVLAPPIPCLCPEIR